MKLQELNKAELIETQGGSICGTVFVVAVAVGLIAKAIDALTGSDAE